MRQVHSAHYRTGATLSINVTIVEQLQSWIERHPVTVHVSPGWRIGQQNAGLTALCDTW